MGDGRSRVASTRNHKKRHIKMRVASDVQAFANVAHSTKTFKDEPSSPRTFRMSKKETLQRIKQVEAQIRTMKEEAEREREATLRNARREALELTEQFQEKGEARYREIVSAAEGAIASEREYPRHQGASERERTNPNRGASAKSPQPRAEHQRRGRGPQESGGAAGRPRTTNRRSPSVRFDRPPP